MKSKGCFWGWLCNVKIVTPLFISIYRRMFLDWKKNFPPLKEKKVESRKRVVWSIFIPMHTKLCVGLSMASNWGVQNWIWHEIRMLVELFDKKILGLTTHGSFFCSPHKSHPKSKLCRATNFQPRQIID